MGSRSILACHSGPGLPAVKAAGPHPQHPGPLRNTMKRSPSRQALAIDRHGRDTTQCRTASTTRAPSSKEDTL